MFYKVILCAFIIIGYSYFGTAMIYPRHDTQNELQQLDSSKDVGNLRETIISRHVERNSQYVIGWICILSLIFLIFNKEIVNMQMQVKKVASILVLSFMVVGLTGCYRPFEPVKLEVIKPNEEAFLLPYTESVNKQSSTNTEEFLAKNLVYTQQVKIPQQWVQLGFNVNNGEWRDAAILVKVDKSPVTREWTADPNSGTSTRNEAVWVMTSDQVEFSTGWTCTARIASRDDAVKFLYNYPNGSLEKVMDGEVRARLQAVFGLEVTDLPMTELRIHATPHIVKVVDDLKQFFHERGITITNLGITGGFVYKDPSIIKTMVEVFNAEQKQAVAQAITRAQAETNKTIQLEAEAKAKAILTVQEAEAKGIQLIADAKAYEINKAKEDASTYLMLKKIEIEKVKIDKWDGKFPHYFMGGSDKLNLLLQSPADK